MRKSSLKLVSGCTDFRSMNRRRTLSWHIAESGAHPLPKSVDDLSFTSRDHEGRINWWNVTPPNTDYGAVHELLGRAYAFELLDLIHNPEGECSPKILGYIAGTALRSFGPEDWGGSTVVCGFFDAISEFLVTGRLDR